MGIAHQTTTNVPITATTEMMAQLVMQPTVAVFAHTTVSLERVPEDNGLSVVQAVVLAQASQMKTLVHRIHTTMDVLGRMIPIHALAVIILATAQECMALRAMEPLLAVASTIKLIVTMKQDAPGRLQLLSHFLQSFLRQIEIIGSTILAQQTLTL